MRRCRECVGFQLKGKRSKKMIAVIKNNQVILVTRDARNRGCHNVLIENS
jgi:hypothetical protein